MKNKCEHRNETIMSFDFIDLPDNGNFTVRVCYECKTVEISTTYKKRISLEKLKEVLGT